MTRIILILSAILLAIAPPVLAGWDVAKTTIVESTIVGAAENTSCDISFVEQKSATLTHSTDTLSTSGNITNGSAVVTGMDTFGIEPGMWVTDSNDEVPVDTTVESIDSSSQLTLSANATGTRSSTTLVFTPTECDRMTFTSIGGITTGAKIDDATVESLDSATQVTLNGSVVKTTTEAQTVDVSASYESITVTVEIVADSAASSASIEFYAMHQGHASTDSFHDKTYTSIGGTTKTYMYKVSLSTAPKFRVMINNLTTESGSDDDITVTVTYAGYSS